MQGELSDNFEPVTLKLDDLAFIQPTGGTTGLSKGASLTHKNLLSNVAQARAWIGHDLVEGKEVVMTALPLYHIFSMMANGLLFLTLGGLNVLVTNPRDLKQFVKQLQPYQITVMTGVNTLFNLLIHHKPFCELDFSKMKFSLGGGMPVQRKVADNWKEITGRPLLEAYGLTETSPAVCICPLDQEEFNGSIGLPLPSTNVKIVSDNGNEVEIGQVGELCIQGPQVMMGYYEQEQETKQALSEDGWFKTGDMATMHENGFLYIVDRKKDMILVSGFNVFPAEVEEVMSMHPMIKEVSVIGIPNERSGEMVKMFVVKEEGEITEKELLSYAKENLTAYKCPSAIEFRDELPKSNVGKIIRRVLREQELAKL